MCQDYSLYTTPVMCQRQLYTTVLDCTKYMCTVTVAVQLYHHMYLGTAAVLPAQQTRAAGRVHNKPEPPSSSTAVTETGLG